MARERKSAFVAAERIHQAESVPRVNVRARSSPKPLLTRRETVNVVDMTQT